MLCDKCGKNNAEVFYKENINGKETKYSLCHECGENGEGRRDQLQGAALLR